MGLFAVGDLIIVRFPFSDLSSKKLRPALVIAHSDFDNYIIVQITSKLPLGGSGIIVDNNDFEENKPLREASYIRYNKIFTADPKLIIKSLGRINKAKRREVHSKLVQTFDKLK